MLSDCECFNVRETQVLLDSLDDRIEFLEKVKQRGEKRNLRMLSGIVIFGIDDIISDTKKLKKDVSNVKICGRD